VGSSTRRRQGSPRVVATLDRYWRLALAPFWPQMRALLQADVTYRLDQIASGGVTQLLRTLHPSLSFDGRTLRIVKYYDGYTQLGRRGLLLVPCAFAWPDVIVQTADPHPTVSYSPRGLGRLWEGPTMPVDSALANVIGRTRATLLAQLDLPMSTTQLAVQLGLSAPTLNVHLKALQSGRHRDGPPRWPRCPLQPHSPRRTPVVRVGLRMESSPNMILVLTRHLVGEIIDPCSKSR
jgi:hypothetical protein